MHRKDIFAISNPNVVQVGVEGSIWKTYFY